MSTIKHNDWLFEQLKDAEFAAEYLNAASEDDDPKTYLTALRKVVEARGGMPLLHKRLTCRARRFTERCHLVATPPSEHLAQCSRQLVLSLAYLLTELTAFVQQGLPTPSAQTNAQQRA